MTTTQKVITALIAAGAIVLIVWGLSNLKGKKGVGSSKNNKSSKYNKRPTPVQPRPSPDLPVDPPATPVEPTEPTVPSDPITIEPIPSNGNDAESLFSSATGINLADTSVSLGDLYRVDARPQGEIPLLPA